MRFPAVSPPKQPPRSAVAIEPMRRLASARLPQPPCESLRPGPLPTALDERVRLVGEW